MLYLAEESRGGEVERESEVRTTPTIVEDEVDAVLDQRDGKIDRQRDPQLYVVDSGLLFEG